MIFRHGSAIIMVVNMKVRPEMKLLTAENGVKYLVSELLRAPHAFATRVGGLSEAPHTASLNLAFGRGDGDSTVIENLRLFGEAAGFAPESVISLPQIHSDRVLTVGVADCGEGYFRATDRACDGYVTSERGVTLGVKTADCVPILLEARDENGQTCAVSAIHSGWRGTAQRIVARGVEGLVGLGATPDRIFAAIGPCIGGHCYEVDSDCRAALEAVNRGRGCIADGKNSKYFPDLAALNRLILLDCGLPEGNIDVCGLCTHCEGELFYSHRRQKGLRGTQLSVIFMP